MFCSWFEIIFILCIVFKENKWEDTENVEENKIFLSNEILSNKYMCVYVYCSMQELHFTKLVLNCFILCLFPLQILMFPFSLQLSDIRI